MSGMKKRLKNIKSFRSNDGKWNVYKTYSPQLKSSPFPTIFRILWESSTTNGWKNISGLKRVTGFHYLILKRKLLTKAGSSSMQNGRVKLWERPPCWKSPDLFSNLEKWLSPEKPKVTGSERLCLSIASALPGNNLQKNWSCTPIRSYSQPYIFIENTGSGKSRSNPDFMKEQISKWKNI